MSGSEVSRPLVTFRKLPRAANVDLAFEKGSVFEVDALCNCVSGKRSFAVHFQTVAGVDIADNLALHDDFAGSNSCINLSIAANRDAISGKVDRSFDLAIDVKRFRTGNLTLDHERFADRCTMVPVSSIGRLRWAYR